MRVDRPSAAAVPPRRQRRRGQGVHVGANANRFGWFRFSTGNQSKYRKTAQAGGISVGTRTQIVVKRALASHGKRQGRCAARNAGAQTPPPASPGARHAERRPPPRRCARARRTKTCTYRQQRSRQCVAFSLLLLLREAWSLRRKHGDGRSSSVWGTKSI